MKSKTLAVAINLLVISYFSLLPGINLSYADKDRWDSGRTHYSRHRYYEHRRYYPGEFYFYRKVYYYPSRTYYYYYDVYPEKRHYYESEKVIVAGNPEYLPITSIANMASQGVPDAIIISEIERTHSVYKLNSEIISYLKQNNASDRVIDAMLESGKKHRL